MRVHLETPPGYSFRRTVLSHGWCALAPFSLAPAVSSLATSVSIGGGRASRITLTPADGHVVLESPGRAGARATETLVAAARHILALDVDLSGFYAMVREHERWVWIERTGSGRMLRGASGFEDLVKLVLTTNCSWSLTKKMVSALVELWGDPASDGTKAFPGAEVLARAGTRALRDKARTGYRAPYLAELSRMVVRGEIDPEGWPTDPRAVDELSRELLALPGVGPYVAQNLLKFLGRPQGLALDSWMRGKYADLFHGGRRVSDRTIARRYGKLGDWAGPALWLDLTRDWWEGDEPSKLWDTIG